MTVDRAQWSRVKLLGLDVDGVLTDNTLVIDENACEAKRFNVSDGLGHSLMREVGIEIIWVSGRYSGATTARAAELKVKTVLQVDPDAKVEAIEKVLRKRGIDWHEMAFVGDDLADLPVFAHVGLAIAVANASDLVKAKAHHVTTKCGGHGAVREVIESFLMATGQFERAAVRYLRPAPTR